MMSILTFLLSSLLASAAPFPATATSVLTDPAKNVFFHGFGFKLNHLEPAWMAVPSIGESVFDSIRFEPKGITAGDSTISIRMDRLPEKSSLEMYAKKWMREYPTYGFEVLGTKNLLLGGGRALLVDLAQKSKNRQLRQVIMQKKDRVAILTCLDQKEKFSATLQTCNRLILGFEWIEDLQQSPSKTSTTITR